MSRGVSRCLLLMTNNVIRHSICKSSLSRRLFIGEDRRPCRVCGKAEWGRVTQCHAVCHAESRAAAAAGEFQKSKVPESDELIRQLID